MSQEAWADTARFLHPRYNLHAEERGFRHASDVFRGKTVLVLDSVSPPAEVLVDLVHAAGGQVTAMVDDPDVTFAVFGKLTCSLHDLIILFFTTEVRYREKDKMLIALF